MSFQAIVTRESEIRTKRNLERIYDRTRRRSVRDGIRQVGQRTTKAAKAAAPRGRTRGQFMRSLAHKERSYANRNIYLTMIGQNRDRRSTARQVALAAKRTGRISRGLSGQGKEPAIHWIEAGTSSHRIAPRSARRLYWNIRKGDVRVPMESAEAVTHPGHAGTGFLSQTERRLRESNAALVINKVQRDIVAEARAALTT